MIPPINSGLVFQRWKEGHFKLSKTPLNEMLGYRQDTAEKLEAGGVLMGRHVLSTADIIVDAITTPLTGDVRSRHRFARSAEPHQAVIDAMWAKSKKTCTYLGEWHTHPEPKPRPSMIDLLNWQRKLVLDQFSGIIFFVIVGTQKVSVWEGTKRRLKITDLDAAEVQYCE